jgi:hypothetical protein
MYSHPMIAEAVRDLSEIADRRAARAARRRQRAHARREAETVRAGSWADRLRSARPHPAARDG